MDSTIQLNYSKKQLRSSWMFGILWLIIFAFYFFFRKDSYFGYGYLVIGIFFLATYMYKKFYHYATIKNGNLIKKSIIPKRIKLDQITDVRYFSGKYALLTDASEMTINTMVLDKRSLEDLKQILQKLNLPKP